MADEVFLRKDRGGNKVRLVGSRQEDVTEEKRHTVKVSPYGRVVDCPSAPVVIAGIDTGNAYTANDSVGLLTRVKVPPSGIIYSATLWDLDYDGFQIDLMIFKDKVAQVADDAAWAPTDLSILSFVTALAMVPATDHSASKTAELTNIGKAYTAPSGEFWIQAVARGASNIAAGSEPRFQLQIMPDDPNWEA